jgi:hypothetical protein
MDYSWMATPDAADEPSMTPMLGRSPVRSPVRSLADAVARQEEYQRLLADALPGRTEVYLANWWSATPNDWAVELDAGWTSRLRRRPVFWDNQQQNDFRAALVLPMSLHQRPAAFAEGLRGYTVNSGVPLSAFAPASMTAGAWAWNPHDYDPGAAMGAAVDRIYGAAGPAVTEALAEWSALLDELLQPRTGMEQHYRGLLLAVRGGRRGQIEAALDGVADRLAVAREALPATAPPMAQDGLDELEREVGRLRLDLALAACTDRDEGEQLVAEIARVLASRLPPVPALRAVVDGTSTDDAPVPGISWAIHFLFGPLGAGPRRLLGKIPPRDGSVASP